jgi:MFS family permease
MANVLKSVTALLAGVGFLLTGHGLLLTAVPLRAVAENFGSIEIGILGSAYYVGFIAGCLLTPFLILRAGHIRAFAALIAVAAASALVLPLAIDFWPWFLARVATGVSLAGLFMVIESWLNDRSTNRNRGLVFSAYIATNFTAIATGQLLVAAGDPSSFKLFIISGLLIGLATIPVVLTRSAQPAPIALVRFRPVELFKRSPVGVVGVTLIGMATGSFWTLAALFAVGKGLAPDQAALFVGIAVVGGVIAQWPVGRLSDRVDRRYILLALLAASTAIGLGVAILPLNATAMLIIAFPLGSTLLSCYAIASAHAYDYADRSEYVETSAGLLFANGVGSMVGPLCASSLMAGIGAAGLFIFTGAAELGLIAFVVYRLSRRASLATDLKVEFSLGATSPSGAIVTPEPLDPTSADVAVPRPRAAEAPVDGEDAPVDGEDAPEEAKADVAEPSA